MQNNPNNNNNNVDSNEKPGDKWEAQITPSSAPMETETAGPSPSSPSRDQSPPPAPENRKQKRLSNPVPKEMKDGNKKAALSDNAGTFAATDFLKSVNLATGIAGPFVPVFMQRKVPESLLQTPREAIKFAPLPYQQEELKRMFPGHWFSYQSGLHEHGVLRHADLHAEYVVFSKHFSSKHQSVWPVDYMGNPERHQENHRDEVTVVHPIRSADDAARMSRFLEKGAITDLICTHPLDANGFTCPPPSREVVTDSVTGKEPRCSIDKRGHFWADATRQATHLYSLHSIYDVTPRQLMGMLKSVSTHTGYVVVHDFSAGRGNHVQEMTFEVHPGGEKVTCQVRGEKALTHGTASWLNDGHILHENGHTLVASLVDSFAHLKIFWVGVLPMTEEQFKFAVKVEPLTLADSVGSNKRIGMVDVSSLERIKAPITKVYSFMNHLLATYEEKKNVWVSKEIVAHLASFAVGKARTPTLASDLFRRCRIRLEAEKNLSATEKLAATPAMVYMSMALSLEAEIACATAFVHDNSAQIELQLNALSLRPLDEYDYLASLITAGRVKRLPPALRNPALLFIMLFPLLVLLIPAIPFPRFLGGSIFHVVGQAALPGSVVEVLLPSVHNLGPITYFADTPVFSALCLHDANPPPIDPLNSLSHGALPPCKITVGNVLVGIGLGNHIPTVANNCSQNMITALRHRVVKERPAYSHMVTNHSIREFQDALRMFYDGEFIGEPNFNDWVDNSHSFSAGRKAKLREADRSQDVPFEKRMRVFVKRENMVKGWNESDEPKFYAPRVIFAHDDEMLVQCGMFTAKVQETLCAKHNGTGESHVVFVAGLSSDQIGSIVYHFLQGKKVTLISESDGVRYDFHELLITQKIVMNFWIPMGVPARVVDYQIAASNPVSGVHNNQGCTLRFKAVDIMPTGADRTWVMNSSVSAGITTMGLRKSYEVTPNNTLLLVAGDDNSLFVVEVLTDPNSILLNIKLAWAQFFFNTQVIRRLDPHDSEFCSSLLWPVAKAENGEVTWVLGPKPGRWFKCMFQVNASIEAERSSWLRGMCKGVLRDVSFIPIIGSVVKRCLSILGEGPTIESKNHDYNFHTKGDFVQVDETRQMFKSRYNCDESDITEVENLVANVSHLPALISHPLLDIMVNVDVHDTATKLVASFMRTPKYITLTDYICLFGLQNTTLAKWWNTELADHPFGQDYVCSQSNSSFNQRLSDELKDVKTEVDHEIAELRKVRKQLGEVEWLPFFQNMAIAWWVQCLAVPLLEELVKTNLWSGVIFSLLEFAISFPQAGAIRALPLLMHLVSLMFPYWQRVAIHSTWNLVSLIWGFVAGGW